MFETLRRPTARRPFTEVQRVKEAEQQNAFSAMHGREFRRRLETFEKAGHIHWTTRQSDALEMAARLHRRPSPPIPTSAGLCSRTRTRTLRRSTSTRAPSTRNAATWRRPDLDDDARQGSLCRRRPHPVQRQRQDAGRAQRGANQWPRWHDCRARDWQGRQGARDR